MKIVKIKSYVFGGNLTLYHSCSIEQVLEHIKKTIKLIPSNKEDLIGEKDGMFFKLDGPKTYYVLWLKKFDWSILHQGLLTHETLHYVFCVLKDAGIKYDYETSEETFTYYFQAQYSQILNALKDKHPYYKKKKNR